MAKFGKKRSKGSEPDAPSGSLGGALLLGGLSALLGFFLGIAHLAHQPVELVRTLPAADERAPRTVYYVAGQDRGGAGFRTVQAQLLSGEPMAARLSEAELNAWSRESFRFDAEDASIARGLIAILPAPPRFHMTDDVMHIGMNLNVSLFGREQEMTYQALGDFVQNGDFRFKAAEIYLGSARIPTVILGPLLNYILLRPFEYAETWQTLRPAWSGLSDVAVESSNLVLLRR